MKIKAERVTSQDGVSVDHLDLVGIRDVGKAVDRRGRLPMVYLHGKSKDQFKTLFATKRLGPGEYVMSCPVCQVKRFLITKDPANKCYWGTCSFCKRAWVVNTSEKDVNILFELKPIRSAPPKLK